MRLAIGMVELSSIARGIETCDYMRRSACPTDWHRPTAMRTMIPPPVPSPRWMCWYGCMCVLVTDGVMWAIDGLPGLFVRIAAYAVNIAYFACQILTTVLWFRYSWYRVYRKQMTARQKRILYIPMALVLLCDLSSPVTGLLFYLDAQNVYHRGALIGHRRARGHHG